MPKQQNFDHLLFLVVLILMGLGLVMVYSSSALIAEGRYHVPSYYFLKKQAICMGSALMVLLVTMMVSYKWWRKVCYVLLVFSVLLLVLVFFPTLGKRAGGACRWLNLPGFSFQPAEFAKLVLILYLAHFLAKKVDAIEDMKAIFLPLFIVLGLSFLLIVKQPDLGTGVVIVLIAFSMVFAAGAKKRQLFCIAGSFLLCLTGLIYLVRYRLQRILIFMNPWKDPAGKGYQMVQSFYALGAGGWFGQGLGHGIQKSGYLPEAHTDFIFSVIGEELGFIGAIAVLALFGVFIWRGFWIARRTEDPFACWLALGITCLIGCQALINIGVAIGILPTKGLALPFVSFGGSSLMVNALAVGILLNISRAVS